MWRFTFRFDFVSNRLLTGLSPWAALIWIHSRPLRASIDRSSRVNVSRSATPPITTSSTMYT